MEAEQIAKALIRFPPVKVPRTVYFEGLDPDFRAALEANGYRPVEIMTLPRETPMEQAAYLLAKAQAFDEYTIVHTAECRKTLELEMRAHGLLDKRSMNLKVNVSAGADEISKLLAWAPDRHTMAGNSTAIFAQLPQAQKAED
jgi:hypothetical protein